MSSLTISFTPSDPAPADGYVVNYRIKGSSDPFTTVLPAPTSSPVVIPGLSEATNYEGTISANCGYGLSTIVNFQSNNCFCPPGYTVSPDSTYCYQELSQDATYTGGDNPFQACHFTYEQYSLFGAVAYQLNGYNPDGTWITPPNIYTNLAPGAIPNANVINHTTGPFINIAGDNISGRLNASGLWVCGNQNYAGTLGFSRQFNLATSKVYYIGLGADNFASIAINGTTIVSQNKSAMAVPSQMNDGSGSFLFRMWFLYPVQMQSGVNLIQIEGTNTDGIGIFGCEIYDATEAQLLACNSTDDLQPFIVFSTKDVADNSDFDTGNYSCSSFPGYQLVFDSGSGTYTCKILNQSACA
ncbi:MAG TPA: fibronectin type III domain-containing protein [Puia sp.]|jgi:hypothetical protein